MITTLLPLIFGTIIVSLPEDEYTFPINFSHNIAVSIHSDESINELEFYFRVEPQPNFRPYFSNFETAPNIPAGLDWGQWQTGEQVHRITWSDPIVISGEILIATFKTQHTQGLYNLEIQTRVDSDSGNKFLETIDVAVLVIPEPGSLILLILGLIIIGVYYGYYKRD